MGGSPLLCAIVRVGDCMDAISKICTHVCIRKIRRTIEASSARAADACQLAALVSVWPCPKLANSWPKGRCGTPS